MFMLHSFEGCLKSLCTQIKSFRICQNICAGGAPKGLLGQICVGGALKRPPKQICAGRRLGAPLAQILLHICATTPEIF